MKRYISKAVLTAGAIMGLAMTSQAVMIDGSLSFSGTYTLDNNDLSLAKKFLTFTDVVVDDPTGDYASVGQSYGPVTFVPFSFDGTEILPFQLWTFSKAGVTYSFNSTSVVKEYAKPDGTSLVVDGVGIAYMTGKDPTPGDWTVSANRAGKKPKYTFSFSASSDAFPVPDGGLTVTLLGLAMAGLGVVRRVVRA